MISSQRTAKAPDRRVLRMRGSLLKVYRQSCLGCAVRREHPCQSRTTMFGTPASAIVGTSGNSAERSFDDTAAHAAAGLDELQTPKSSTRNSWRSCRRQQVRDSRAAAFVSDVSELDAGRQRKEFTDQMRRAAQARRCKHEFARFLLRGGDQVFH